MPPRERPRRRERGGDGGEDLGRFGHPARARLAAGHGADAGPDREDPVRGKGREVAPRRGMLPHPHVHRGRDQHALVGRKQKGRGKVVADPRRHLGHEVGRRRRHHHQIGLAREADMPHLGLGRGVEEVGLAPPARECRERERGHERRPRRGQDGRHRAPRPGDEPHEVGRLEGRDAAPDDQKDALARQHDRPRNTLRSLRRQVVDWQLPCVSPRRCARAGRCAGTHRGHGCASAPRSGDSSARRPRI